MNGEGVVRGNTDLGGRDLGYSSGSIMDYC